LIAIEDTPEEQMHNMLSEIKANQDAKAKYKAITGKEAERDFTKDDLQKFQTAKSLDKMENPFYAV
jgi:hypothetical protein